jgi:hypothetical protein
MRRYSSRLMATKPVCVCTLDSQRVSHFRLLALHHPILLMLYIQQRFDWWLAIVDTSATVNDISPGKWKVIFIFYLNKKGEQRNK